MCVCVCVYLATLKSSDRTKHSVDDNIYTLPQGIEHSGKGIFGRRSHNAKLFERIEYPGSR